MCPPSCRCTDKARVTTTTTGSERVQGSSQGASPTASKPNSTETRGLGRSTEMATGGIANQKESVVAKAEDLVDAASDELYLDSDVPADNECWQQIAKNFAVKPSDTLRRLRSRRPRARGVPCQRLVCIQSNRCVDRMLGSSIRGSGRKFLQH